MAFLLTGTFPELGGGIGLDAGKTRVDDLIAKFGGRVVSAMSGKVTALVAGAAPGASKLAAARAKGLPVLTINALCSAVNEGLPLALAAEREPLEIAEKDLSKGYGGKARIASKQKRTLAIGTTITDGDKGKEPKMARTTVPVKKAYPWAYPYNAPWFLALASAPTPTLMHSRRFWRITWAFLATLQSSAVCCPERLGPFRNSSTVGRLLRTLRRAGRAFVS
eukprot:6558165-Prymnesium_polylepis.1